MIARNIATAKAALEGKGRHCLVCNKPGGTPLVIAKPFMEYYAHSNCASKARPLLIMLSEERRKASERIEILKDVYALMEKSCSVERLTDDEAFHLRDMLQAVIAKGAP